MRHPGPFRRYRQVIQRLTAKPSKPNCATVSNNPMKRGSRQVVTMPILSSRTPLRALYLTGRLFGCRSDALRTRLRIAEQVHGYGRVPSMARRQIFEKAVATRLEDAWGGGGGGGIPTGSAVLARSGYIVAGSIRVQAGHKPNVSGGCWIIACAVESEQ